MLSYSGNKEARLQALSAALWTGLRLVSVPGGAYYFEKCHTVYSLTSVEADAPTFHTQSVSPYF